MDKASFGLYACDEINGFLNSTSVSGGRLSHIWFSGETEPWKEFGDKSVITSEWTILEFENGKFVSVFLEGGMYSKANFRHGSNYDSWFKNLENKLIDGSSLFPQTIGKKIASIGYNRIGKQDSGLCVLFSDGSFVSLNWPNEDFYQVIYFEKESKPLCLPLWESIHTQCKLLERRPEFTFEELNTQLKASGAYIEYLRDMTEPKQIMEYREKFEKYYIYDVIPEDEFLNLCNRFDSEINENSDYLLTSKHEYFRLNHYVSDLQRITHRRPSVKHEWLYLKVTSDEERYRYYDICDEAFRHDLDTWELSILKPDENGEVRPIKPTKYECGMFSRNWMDSSVISKEIAYKLALNPGLSY